MNGFGWASRDTGHNLLPTPPDKITGIKSIFSNPYAQTVGRLMLQRETNCYRLAPEMLWIRLLSNGDDTCRLIARTKGTGSEAQQDIREI